MVERQHDSCAQVSTGQVVADVAAHPGGFIVGIACGVHNSALSLDGDIVGDVIPLWPHRAIRGKLAIHQGGIDLGEFLKTQAHLFHSSVLEVLHQYIGILHQVSEDLLTLIVLQVQGNALLTPVGVTVIGADTVNKGRIIPDGITDSWAFHLDNFRSIIGKLCISEWVDRRQI